MCATYCAFATVPARPARPGEVPRNRSKGEIPRRAAAPGSARGASGPPRSHGQRVEDHGGWVADGAFTPAQAGIDYSRCHSNHIAVRSP